MTLNITNTNNKYFTQQSSHYGTFRLEMQWKWFNLQLPDFGLNNHSSKFGQLNKFPTNNLKIGIYNCTSSQMCNSITCIHLNLFLIVNVSNVLTRNVNTIDFRKQTRWKKLRLFCIYDSGIVSDETAVIVISKLPKGIALIAFDFLKLRHPIWIDLWIENSLLN